MSNFIDWATTKREREVFGNLLAQINPPPKDEEVLRLHEFYLLGIAIGRETSLTQLAALRGEGEKDGA